MGELRYPEDRSMILKGLETRHQRFAELREQYLLGFGHNTARAYWGDLDHIYRWAELRGKDVLRLTEPEFRQYLALMKRRGYSASTIRRRRTAWRGFTRLRR